MLSSASDCKRGDKGPGRRRGSRGARTDDLVGLGGALGAPKLGTREDAVRCVEQQHGRPRVGVSLLPELRDVWVLARDLVVVRRHARRRD
eukprot:791223-Prymnesium_polylepis.1